MTCTRRRTTHKRVANEISKSKQECRRKDRIHRTRLFKNSFFVMSLKERDISRVVKDEEARQLYIYALRFNVPQPSSRPLGFSFTHIAHITRETIRSHSLTFPIPCYVANPRLSLLPTLTGSKWTCLRTTLARISWRLSELYQY